MKRITHKNVLLVSLSLILSLVAYTNVDNLLPVEAVKTALVVNEPSFKTQFSLAYHKAITLVFIDNARFAAFNFSQFRKEFTTKANTAFKTYTHHTLSLRATQLHTKLYSYAAHQTLYNNSIS